MNAEPSRPAMWEKTEAREKEVRQQVQFLSEYLPEVRLQDVEIIARVAFGAGLNQGYKECIEQLDKKKT